MPETLKPQFQHFSRGIFFRRHVTFLLFFPFCFTLNYSSFEFNFIQAAFTLFFWHTRLLVCLRFMSTYWLIRLAYHATRHTRFIFDLFSFPFRHIYSVVCVYVRTINTERLLSLLCIDNDCTEECVVCIIIIHNVLKQNPNKNRIITHELTHW